MTCIYSSTCPPYDKYGNANLLAFGQVKGSVSCSGSLSWVKQSSLRWYRQAVNLLKHVFWKLLLALFIFIWGRRAQEKRLIVLYAFISTWNKDNIWLIWNFMFLTVTVAINMINLVLITKNGKYKCNFELKRLKELFSSMLLPLLFFLVMHHMVVVSISWKKLCVIGIGC